MAVMTETKCYNAQKWRRSCSHHTLYHCIADKHALRTRPYSYYQWWQTKQLLWLSFNKLWLSGINFQNARFHTIILLI